MSQRGRPDADEFVGGWTPLPLYAQLDEPVPDDSDFITSPSLPPPSTFIVHLDPLSPPIAGPDEDAVRPHVLTVRLAGGLCTSTVVTLINTLGGADRWIKSQNYTLAAGFSDYSLSLTYREAAQIEDYTTLKLMVTVFADASCGSGGGGGSGGGSGGGGGGGSGGVPRPGSFSSSSGSSSASSSSSSGSESLSSRSSASRSASVSASQGSTGPASSAASQGSGSVSSSSGRPANCCPTAPNTLTYTLTAPLGGSRSR